MVYPWNTLPLYVVPNKLSINTYVSTETGSGDMADLGVHEFTLKGSSEPVTFKVTRGDYSPLMRRLVENLAKAKVCGLWLILMRHIK